MRQIHVRSRGTSSSMPTGKLQWNRVFLIWFTFLVVGGWMHWFGYGVSAETRMRPYVVQPGDSVWTIAMREVRGVDPRILADQIERINHLPASDRILPGQILSIPSGK